MSIRIHELAAKIGKTNRELMALLKGRKIIGADVKSPSSTISDIYADYVAKEFGVILEHTPAAPLIAAATTTAQASPAPKVTSGTVQPKVLPSWHMVKSAQEVERERATKATKIRAKPETETAPPPAPSPIQQPTDKIKTMDLRGAEPRTPDPVKGTPAVRANPQAGAECLEVPESELKPGVPSPGAGSTAAAHGGQMLPKATASSPAKSPRFLPNSIKFLVVDGSNIASEGLKRPSISHLLRALKDLAAVCPQAKIRVILAATIPHLLTDADQEDLPALIAGKFHPSWKFVVSKAGIDNDVHILEVAEEKNGTVISNDRFKKWWKQHPWLLDAGRAFVAQEPTDDDEGWKFFPKGRPNTEPEQRRR